MRTEAFCIPPPSSCIIFLFEERLKTNLKIAENFPSSFILHPFASNYHPSKYLRRRFRRKRDRLPVHHNVERPAKWLLTVEFNPCARQEFQLCRVAQKSWIVPQ